MVTILVAGHRPQARDLILDVLSGSGHQILVSSNGEEALRIAKSNRLDLILTDILMPSIGGYEFVARLRSDPVTADTQILFSAADYLRSETQSLAEACGVPWILLKDTDRTAILPAVNLALARKSNRTTSANGSAAVAVSTPQTRKCPAPSLQEVAELTAQLSPELKPERLVQRFLDGARSLMPADVAVVRIDQEGSMENPLFLMSSTEELTDVHLAAELASTLKRLTTRDSGVTGALPSTGDERPRSLISAQVRSGDRGLGWLCFHDSRNESAFTVEHSRAAQALGIHLGNAYSASVKLQESATTVAELQRRVEADTDGSKQITAGTHRYQMLLEGSLDGVLVHDNEGRYVEVNSQACKMLGYGREELLGLKAADLIPEGEKPVDLFNSKRTADEPIQLQRRLRRKDGKIIHAEMCLSLLEGGYVQAIVRDITKGHQLEEQLRHAQKMEAMGCLAGGIAHDFNNLLTAIIGYSQFALGLSQRNKPVHRELEEIRMAGVRAAELTGQLLAFSRKQALDRRIIDINATVKSTERMLKRLIGEDIELVTILDPSLGTIQADPGQIEQVIINLAVNGRDAMQSGGRLTIQTSNVDLDDEYARQHVAVQAGPHVMMSISDSGSGMDKLTQARIFEPFYTTKEQGKGTGLGLSTVYGIVKQSGGNIWVYSEPSWGTVFKIYFPRLDRPAETERSEAVAPLPRGAETILLVEDERLVRELGAIVLRELGYNVLTASSGDEAIAISRQRSPAPIHLLLSDVVMPRISGKELARRLAAERPELKVLFVSGYTDDAVVQHGLLEARDCFLQKPFTPTSLASRVREMLDRSR